MRLRDKGVFRKAAQKFQAWILVRQSNKASLDFVEHRIYRPKPISCKPKTATNAVIGRTIVGLVADPVRWPEAFADRGAEALKLWTEFRTHHNLGEFRRQPRGGFVFEGARSAGSGYSIDAEPGSKHEGCLTYEGKYIYGDYDLFDIVFPAATARESVSQVAVGPKNSPQFQTVDHRSARWAEVSTFLNGQLGFELIQHGAQFDWKNDKVEAVEAFGPNGEIHTWSAAQTASKYREWQRASG